MKIENSSWRDVSNHVKWKLIWVIIRNNLSINLNIKLNLRLKSKLELAKKNVLTLAIAQGLSITSTGINIIHTGLVGVMLAPKPEYATIPLSFQFITVALTLIPISLLMGKFGRKIIFFHLEHLPLI